MFLSLSPLFYQELYRRVGTMNCQNYTLVQKCWHSHEVLGCGNWTVAFCRLYICAYFKFQVNLIHVASTCKNAADEKLRQTIRRFADIHGSPAAIILISGDINFAADLNDLRHRYSVSVCNRDFDTRYITCVLFSAVIFQSHSMRNYVFYRQPLDLCPIFNRLTKMKIHSLYFFRINMWQDKRNWTVLCRYHVFYCKAWVRHKMPMPHT